MNLSDHSKSMHQKLSELRKKFEGYNCRDWIDRLVENIRYNRMV